MCKTPVIPESTVPEVPTTAAPKVEPAAADFREEANRKGYEEFDDIMRKAGDIRPK